MQTSRTPVLVESYRTCSMPATTGCYDISETLLPWKLTGDSVTTVFSGAGPIGARCLAGTKTPESKKENRCSACFFMLFVQFQHSEPILSVGSNFISVQGTVHHSSS